MIDGYMEPAAQVFPAADEEVHLPVDKDASYNSIIPCTKSDCKE